MKNRKQFLLLTLLFSFIISPMQAQDQEGPFIAVDYKIGYTRLSNAYTTYNPGPTSTSPQQSDLTFYSDAFIQKNLSVYFGTQTETFYFRTNIDGLFNWLFVEYDKYYYMKSSFRKFEDVQAENAFISKPEKKEGGKHLHPVNGAADYKMINADILFGNEDIKIGTNLSVGMLGAAMGDGVNPTGTGTSHKEIRTMDLGYYQIGAKALISNINGMPLTASVGINKLRGFNTPQNNSLTKEERRGGFGIDLEAKYYIGDNQFRPYVSFYGEIKRFTKETVTLAYTSGRSTNFRELEIPKLNTLAFGVTLGFIVGDW